MTLVEYYESEQDMLHEAFDQYVDENEWGSGNDRIKITDAIFWEFIESNYYCEVDYE